MADALPQFTRYRLIEDYPDKLRFKNGTVIISFRAHDDKSWFLFAAREDDPKNTVELMRGPSMLQWSTARFEGFEVVSGSPADKIMRRLVRDGWAVEMKPGETFRQKRNWGRAQRYH